MPQQTSTFESHFLTHMQGVAGAYHKLIACSWVPMLQVGGLGKVRVNCFPKAITTWLGWESNPRPPDPESDALTTLPRCPHAATLVTWSLQNCNTRTSLARSFLWHYAWLYSFHLLYCTQISMRWRMTLFISPDVLYTVSLWDDAWLYSFHLLYYTQFSMRWRMTLFISPVVLHTVLYEMTHDSIHFTCCIAHSSLWDDAWLYSFHLLYYTQFSMRWHMTLFISPVVLHTVLYEMTHDSIHFTCCITHSSLWDDAWLYSFHLLYYTQFSMKWRMTLFISPVVLHTVLYEMTHDSIHFTCCITHSSLWDDAWLYSFHLFYYTHFSMRWRMTLFISPVVLDTVLYEMTHDSIHFTCCITHSSLWDDAWLYSFHLLCWTQFSMRWRMTLFISPVVLHTLLYEMTHDSIHFTCCIVHSSLWDDAWLYSFHLLYCTQFSMRWRMTLFISPVVLYTVLYEMTHDSIHFTCCIVHSSLWDDAWLYSFHLLYCTQFSMRWRMTLFISPVVLYTLLYEMTHDSIHFTCCIVHSSLWDDAWLYSFHLLYCTQFSVRWRMTLFISPVILYTVLYKMTHDSIHFTCCIVHSSLWDDAWLYSFYLLYYTHFSMRWRMTLFISPVVLHTVSCETEHSCHHFASVLHTIPCETELGCHHFASVLHTVPCETEHGCHRFACCIMRNIS